MQSRWSGASFGRGEQPIVWTKSILPFSNWGHEETA
jgi:hypothetical protein